MPDVITVTNLEKKYGATVALAGVSFGVAAGSLFGIIGPDGAGKTTLMRILATMIAPDAGSATVLGFDVNRGYDRIRPSIGYMPQRFSLYEDLTVRENMLFFADIFNVPAQERPRRIDRLLGFSRLGPFQDRRAGRLSGGMKQKLALSCALIHTPRLLVLDEPTTGVDPVSRTEFWKILGELHDQGITIVVSTPYMDEAAYCDRLVLLHRGAVIDAASPGELTGRYPKTLYRITGRTALRWNGETPLPPQVHLIYQSAGSLHAVTDRPLDDPAALLDAVRRAVPAADAVEAAAAGIEDCLFLHLSAGER